MIVCGDFGIWNESDKKEKEALDELQKLSFTILFVDGNHENFDRLYSDEFDEIDLLGGKAHGIRNNVYHLKRGYVFTINDKKFFCFGGAKSHDIRDGILNPDDYKSLNEFLREYTAMYNQGKIFRVNHFSWWDKELPSDEEMNNGIINLEKTDYKVDFIISHCAPSSIAKKINKHYDTEDKLTKYFEYIKDNVQFEKWFFGHYHNDQDITDKFKLCYENFERII